TPTQDPPGVIVTIRSKQAKLPPPYDQPLHIWVFSWQEKYTSIRTKLAAKIASGEIKSDLPADAPADLKQAWPDAGINGGFLGWTDGFVVSALKVGITHVRFASGGEFGDKTAPLFLQNWKSDPNPRWQRFNYDAEVGQQCHAIHVALREPDFAVIHFP